MDSTTLDLFSPTEEPIVWRPLSQSSFTIVESKAPTGYRVEGGHLANPTETRVGSRVYPPGRFYRATAHRDGRSLHSPLYDSMEEAKDACDHQRYYGSFPTPHSDN